MTDKIFYREKGTKAWRQGWILERQRDKIKLGNYPGDPFPYVWYDTFDLEIQERK